MGRLVVVLDRGVGISPDEFSVVWAGDAEARGVGAATVDAATPGDFFGVVELVVVPLLVNLTSSAVTALVGRLVAKARSDKAGQPELEIADVTQADGDRVVVVRLGGAHR